MVCGTHVPAVCIGVMLIPRTSAIARPPAGGLLNVERLRAAARPAPKLRVVCMFGCTHDHTVCTALGGLVCRLTSVCPGRGGRQPILNP